MSKKKDIVRITDYFLNLYSVLLFSIFYRMYANSVGPAGALHGDIIMPYISQYGTKEQREKYLPDMTAGKLIGSIAMTEPTAGR